MSFLIPNRQPKVGYGDAVPPYSGGEYGKRPLPVMDAKTTVQLFDRYFNDRTFDNVAHTDTADLSSHLTKKFSLDAEVANHVAVHIQGYAVSQWLTELENQAVEDDIDARLEQESEDYYEADDVFCMSYPGAMM